jgi:hypothetical protein
MKRLLMVTFLVSACGTAPATSSGPETGKDSLVEKPADDQPEGKDNREPAAEGVSALLVADASKLPVCDAAAEGKLVYLRSEKAFKVCAATAWEAIDLRGPAGAEGEDGQDGVDGDDLKLVQAIRCTGDATDGVVGEAGLKFLYEVKVFSNGEIYATGALLSGADSYAGSNFYSATEAAAAEAPIRAAYSSSGYGYYTVSLNRATGTVYVRSFTGAGVLEAGWPLTYTQASKCTTTTF